jgi:hypothetical protein
MPLLSSGDSLRTSLSELLTSGTDTNPALNALLRDYTTYHRVLAVVGGAFFIALTVLSAVLWRRFRRSRTPGQGWSFERRALFGLGLVAVGTALFLALVVAANLSTVLDPRTGFAGALGLLGTPKPGTSAAQLHEAFSTWLQSGASAVPPEVTAAIDDRLSWQRPKAVVCSVLLVVTAALTALAWRSLVRRSRVRQGRRSARERLLLAGAVLGVPVCLLLMLMVLGNVQGSLAPLSLTLFFG